MAKSVKSTFPKGSLDPPKILLNLGYFSRPIGVSDFWGGGKFWNPPKSQEIAEILISSYKTTCRALLCPFWAILGHFLPKYHQI